MYRSNAQDFPLILESEHIRKIYQVIENNFDKYFDSLIEQSVQKDSLEKLKSKWGGNLQSKGDNKLLKNLFSQPIINFGKENEKYKSFFDEEAIQEYRDYDENSFQGHLIKECPVINYSFHSQAEEMKEWKIKFKMTSSSELLDIFSNLLQFCDNYENNYEEQEYKNFDKHDDFGFEEIENEEYGVLGVIGMGIKSTVLYHLYPQIFPKRGKANLYGFYFLSDRQYFKLPSKTSEFLMINDEIKSEKGVYKTDQNYWYPYSLFSLYAIRLYRLIKSKCESINVFVDDNYRYVYVNSYLEHICNYHKEDIKTLTGVESFKKRKD